MIDKFMTDAEIDCRHIEKYADGDFNVHMLMFTALLLDEVYGWVKMNGGLPSQNDYDGLLEHLELKPTR